VNVISTLSLEDHAKYHVVCYTENFDGINNLKQVNAFCHQKGIGFILSETLGLLSYAFTDFGEKHGVSDADGEQCKSFIVSNISNDEQAMITVHEDKRHSYQEGDFVKFTEVEGMPEINGKGPFELTRATGPHSFKIALDTRNFGEYTRQGLVENVKVTKYISFHDLATSYDNPVASSPDGMLPTVDMRAWGRSDSLHCALRAIHEFHSQHKRYSEIADADAVLELAKAINQKAKESNGHHVEELDLEAVKKCAMFASCSIVPQAAMFGGIIAQEIVKLTGKYTPIRQWLHYDIAESVDLKVEADRNPMNCRYDDQIKIYGRAVQEKLGNIKTFMVGAGALGCEYLKAFSLMGLGCGPKGSVTVTDNDNIEVSNLNRQFLFRQQHVGKSKSETASHIAKEMNNSLNVTAHQTYVDPSTENVFDDAFWESLDFIVNAVDNIKARLYVDQKCVWYEKPLLESGTLGTKANSQMVVPFKTKCYGDSQDPPEEGIPMCTLRNFPNIIEHCIEWGRE
jgi:ubiquitin-activating enzyme E1